MITLIMLMMEMGIHLHRHRSNCAGLVNAISMRTLYTLHKATFLKFTVLGIRVYTT